MLNIGLSGGTGSGKSLVAEIIRRYGIPVYDTDVRAKYLMVKDSTIRYQLIEHFGTSIFVRGELNRALLAERIFSSIEDRTFVNSIVHHQVFKDFRNTTKTGSSPIIFVESAILFSSGFASFMHKIVCVQAPADLRIKRVMERDKITEAQALARMATQQADQLAEGDADYLIINDNHHLLVPQVQDLLERLQSFAHKYAANL
ncbi:MAG: dephospho-CoA kinase [Prevotellaceae bacterium]|jgi:dephospho-CoA kinase|nr:dephospho-CoA kinase [Prevotellaceae bacterium]